MKKLVVFLSVLALASCGRVPVEFVSQTKTPWGTIGMAEGWVVKEQLDYNIILESQLEANTEIVIRYVRMPDDLDGYAKSFIEVSGRTLDGTGAIEIDGKDYNLYKMTAIVGGTNVSELLALVPYQGKLLAIDAMWRANSVLADIPEGMVKSIKFGGN